jgi:hypothetical protein
MGIDGHASIPSLSTLEGAVNIVNIVSQSLKTNVFGV